MVANEDGHTVAGTQYGGRAVEAYSQTTHHSDRQRFLSGYVEELLSNVDGDTVIDIGAGLAPWSIYAAQHGASKVFAIDYQQDMVDQALKHIADAGLSEKISARVGDAAHLEFNTGEFNLALSVQVGCNLPNARAGLKEGLSAHFAEMSRALKPKGRALVTAPASFGVIFTGGQRKKEDIVADIESRLAHINETENPSNLQEIQRNLTSLSDVFLASFAMRNNKLVSVTDESILTSGEQIWRKLPGLVVPNYYHPVTQYVDEFKANGLTIKTEYNRGFASEEERNEYNLSLAPEEKLGKEYRDNPPFVVWDLEKV